MTGWGGEAAARERKRVGVVEGAGQPGGLGTQGSCWAAGQWPQPQADPRPGWGGRGSVWRRGSLTGRECRDTTGCGPRARHKLQNNLFPVTHSWGPASTTPPPPPPDPPALVVVAQLEE